MKHNGFEYVDLGLPSGTKWAKCNVGANSETDNGLYFPCGGIVGLDSPYYDGNFDSHKIKYDGDEKVTLHLDNDAAHIHMGGKWHMPTKEQIGELITNTENTFVTNYNYSGVNGRLLTSNINGNQLFFPACGMIFAEDYYGFNYSGNLWSNSVGDDCRNNCGRYLWFGTDSIGIGNRNRTCGLCVRGVFNTFWI